MSRPGYRRTLASGLGGRVGHVLPMMLLLCGLFLAHGVQCAVHPPEPHDSGPITVGVAHSMAQGMSNAIMMAIDAQPVAAQHSPDRHGGALPAHGLPACLAILVGLLVSAILGGRTMRVSHRQRRFVDRADRSGSSLQKWRPAQPRLAVLCVSRV